MIIKTTTSHKNNNNNLIILTFTAFLNFNNMRTLKLKIQIIVTLFTGSITAAGLLENNKGALNGVKTSCACVVIGGFRSTLLVSVFLPSAGCQHNYD